MLLEREKKEEAMLRIQGFNPSLKSSCLKQNICTNQAKSNSIGFKAGMKGALLPEANAIFSRPLLIVEAEGARPSIRGLGLQKFVLCKPLSEKAMEIVQKTDYATQWIRRGGDLPEAMNHYKAAYETAQKHLNGTEEAASIRYVTANNFAFILLHSIFDGQNFKQGATELSKALNILQTMKEEYGITHHDDLISCLINLTAKKAQ